MVIRGKFVFAVSVLFSILMLSSGLLAESIEELKSKRERLLSDVAALDKDLQAVKDTSEYNALIKKREDLKAMIESVSDELNKQAGEAAQGPFMFNQGNRHLKAGAYKEAIEAYLKAIGYEPDNAQYYYNLGLAYQYNRQKNEALEAYINAYTNNSNYGAAYVAAGNIQANLKQYDEALANYEKAAELNPADAKAHHGMGNVYLKKRKFSNAVDAFKKAVENNPAAGDSWVNLGRALHENKKETEAITALEKGLSLKLKDSYKQQANYYLAAAYNAQQKFTNAIAAAERCLKLKRTYAAAWYEKGFALMKLGKKKEAIAAFEESRKDASWKSISDAQIKICKQ